MQKHIIGEYRTIHIIEWYKHKTPLMALDKFLQLFTLQTLATSLTSVLALLKQLHFFHFVQLSLNNAN